MLEPEAPTSSSRSDVAREGLVSAIVQGVLKQSRELETLKRDISKLEK